MATTMGFNSYPVFLCLRHAFAIDVLLLKFYLSSMHPPGDVYVFLVGADYRITQSLCHNL